MEACQGEVREWMSCARRGDFAGAWQLSDRMLQRHLRRPDRDRPRDQQVVWTGEPLNGKRVLVRCYRGLGDTIQFVRYAPMVRAMARELIVWAPRALIPLLESVRGVDRLLPLHDGEPDVAYDVDVEIMELPYVFRTTLEAIPCEVPYLGAGQAVLGGAPPRVGIVWRGGAWDPRRSIPFDALQPLLDLPSVTWFSLQVDRRPAETHPRLIDISDDRVVEAAARIRSLDLLITVDSMPAHLAGALAAPVWTLLRRNADWRWLEDRDDTPWYPTMRLFRQADDGEWIAVVRRVRESLQSISPS